MLPRLCARDALKLFFWLHPPSLALGPVVRRLASSFISSFASAATHTPRHSHPTRRESLLSLLKGQMPWRANLHKLDSTRQLPLAGASSEPRGIRPKRAATRPPSPQAQLLDHASDLLPVRLGPVRTEQPVSPTPASGLGSVVVAQQAPQLVHHCAAHPRPRVIQECPQSPPRLLHPAAAVVAALSLLPVVVRLPCFPLPQRPPPPRSRTPPYSCHPPVDLDARHELAQVARLIARPLRLPTQLTQAHPVVAPKLPAVEEKCGNLQRRHHHPVLALPRP